MKDIIGVILAAGKGKRMHSDIPKVLHPVSGVPMVQLVIDTLKKAGINRIIMVVGYGKERFQKVLDEDIEIVVQGEQQGTGHATGCAVKSIPGFSGTILVACADMPLVKAATIKKLISYHEKNNADCCLLTGNLEDPAGYGRIQRDKEGNIEGIGEDCDITGLEKKITEVNSGMYCFQARELRGVLSLLNKNNKQKEYYLTDTINLLIKRGKKATAYKANDREELIGVNSRKDLVTVNKIIHLRIIEGHMDNGVTIVDPGTTYIGLDVKIGRDTIINPFTVITGRVTIGRSCVIGPFTHIRDKTVIKDRAEVGNFVEVKKSTIGKCTKSKHLTYLGDSILGDNVNIGAGTITANYDGRHKHRTTIRNNAFIGSNTTLVAPVTVGRNAVTGAGSVVLHGRNVPDNSVVAGVPAKLLCKS